MHAGRDHLKALQWGKQLYLRTRARCKWDSHSDYHRITVFYTYLRLFFTCQLHAAGLIKKSDIVLSIKRDSPKIANMNTQQEKPVLYR